MKFLIIKKYEFNYLITSFNKMIKYMLSSTPVVMNMWNLVNVATFYGFVW